MYVTNIVDLINSADKLKYILHMSIAKYEYPIANTLEFINGGECHRDTREHLESLYALLLLKAKDNQEYSNTAREELSKEAVNNLTSTTMHALNKTRCKWLFLELIWYEYNTAIGNYHKVESIQGYKQLYGSYRMVKELIVCEENRLNQTKSKAICEENRLNQTKLKANSKNKKTKDEEPSLFDIQKYITTIPQAIKE